MNQEEYDQFLNNISTLSDIVKSTPDDVKQTDEFKATLESEISKLNEKAESFSQFIASDTAKYDSRIDDLKSTLSFYGDTFSNMLIPSTALIPAGYEPNQQTPSATTPITATDTSQPTAPQTPTIAEPTQETLNAVFTKYMGSSYDPNSPMDKGKMETVKNALKKFQEENNKPFDINDSEDLTKMRPIMNAAYQSEEYKKVAEVGASKAAQSATTARQQTPAQKKATAPASPKGGPTYYVRTGFNRYVPAVEADITSGQQLFMQNPNRAARMVYPYVKVDSRPIRRATPAR